MLDVSRDIAINAEIVKGVKVAGKSGNVLEMSLDSKIFSNRGRSHAVSPSLVAMKRSLFDSLLVDHAVKLGAVFADVTSLETINRETEKMEEWNLGFRSKEENDLSSVQCRVLVGADGRNSRVANLLCGENRGFSKDTISGRIGVQFVVNRPTDIGSDIVMFFFEGGYGGIVGVSARESNIAMVVTQELARLASFDFAQFILKSIHSNKYGKIVIPHVELRGEIRTTFPITPRTNRLDRSNVYLVGDAHHTTEPFTGEGIFFAMQDGVRAAAAISESFGIISGIETPNLRKRFWVDNVFSPILRNEAWAERALALGVRHRNLAEFVGRRVFR